MVVDAASSNGMLEPKCYYDRELILGTQKAIR